MALAISSILGPLSVMSFTIAAIFAWLRLSLKIWGLANLHGIPRDFLIKSMDS
jgi:hypothetical protein